MAGGLIKKRVKIRERGQFTIPADFRQHLGLEEDSVLQVIEIGKALLLIPEDTVVNTLGKQVEYGLKDSGMNLNELLVGLREGNHEYETDQDIS